MSPPRSRLQSLLPYAASTALGLALYALVAIPAEWGVHTAFKQRSYSVGAVLSHALGTALHLQDSKAADAYLAAAAAEPSLVYAVARTVDGKVIGGYRPELAPALPELMSAKPQDVRQGDMLHMGFPVMAGQQRVGWYLVGFDLADLSRQMMRAKLIAALEALVAAGFSALAFSRGASRRKQMLEQIAATSTRLRSTSVQMVSASSQQAAAASEHAAAVEETRRTMQALVEAATRIAAASRDVQAHADQSVQGAAAVSQAIRSFAAQAEKIGDISEVIRSIADKSDLLALNASLEGTKAGEAGRGFSLVANEMRRLSESVLGAAREIKSLAGAIRGASESAETSVMSLRTASARTSDSVREISQITAQQREATEQVTKSMDELGGVLNETGTSIRRTEESAAHLLSLADSLAQLTAEVVRRPIAGQDRGKSA